MKPAFCAISVVCLSLTNNSDRRQIRFIAAIAMTRNLLLDAMVVAKSSVLVSLQLIFISVQNRKWMKPLNNKRNRTNY